MQQETTPLFTSLHTLYLYIFTASLPAAYNTIYVNALQACDVLYMNRCTLMPTSTPVQVLLIFSILICRFIVSAFMGSQSTLLHSNRGSKGHFLLCCRNIHSLAFSSLGLQSMSFWAFFLLRIPLGIIFMA